MDDSCIALCIILKYRVNIDNFVICANYPIQWDYKRYTTIYANEFISGLKMDEFAFKFLTSYLTWKGLIDYVP